MKMISIFSLIFLILFQGPIIAKNAKEDALKTKMKELSYDGQLDTAREMMGEVTKRTSPEKADDEWDMTSLALSGFWGLIGTAYFIYGKKQARYAFLLCGIALCIFPYFISSNMASLVLGLAVSFAPFKLDF